MYSGTFTLSPDAAKLPRSARRPAVHPGHRAVLASAGIPSAADNDPMGASPQGIAVRFQLAEHVHTDIIAQSHNGFPTRTGEEFLEFLQAAAASGPGGPSPPPIVAFLATHPAAKAFVEAPKPIPTSYARQAYFAVTAFKFTNAAGQSRFGRFRLRPDAETEILTPEQAAEKDGRLPRRPNCLSGWPRGRRGSACWCNWPRPGIMSPTLPPSGRRAGRRRSSAPLPSRSASMSWPRSGERSSSTPFRGWTGSTRQATRAAHQMCPYSKATRGNIDVAINLV